MRAIYRIDANSNPKKYTEDNDDSDGETTVVVGNYEKSRSSNQSNVFA